MLDVGWVNQREVSSHMLERTVQAAGGEIHEWASQLRPLHATH